MQVTIHKAEPSPVENPDGFTVTEATFESLNPTHEVFDYENGTSHRVRAQGFTDAVRQVAKQLDLPTPQPYPFLNFLYVSGEGDASRHWAPKADK